MTGMTDYTAKNLLNWMTGQIAEPSLPAVFLALFTGVGTDAATGFTEVSGGSYTRVQVSGNLTANGTWTTSSTSITLSAGAPSWVVAGMTIYDITKGAEIGTIASTFVAGSTTVPLTAAALAASSGASDSLNFSAFAVPSGSQPSSTNNGAVITFPQASANWGTVIAWGLYDAVSSGNLLLWDFMGNFAWLPVSVSNASPAVFTTHTHGYANGDPIVASVEYGGTFPTVSAGGPLTSYTVNYALSVATDTFQLNTQSGGGGTTMNTSASGDLLVRKITQQSIPQNVTASFAAATFTVNAA